MPGGLFHTSSVSPVTKCMAVVLICIAVDLLGLSLTIPILANFAREVQGTPEGCPLPGAANFTTQLASQQCQDGIALVKANTGVLNTVYALSMMISTLWMPWFSDKYGRRPAIMISIFGSLIGFLGQGLTCAENPIEECHGINGGFGFLIAVRAFGGLFGGTATVAAAFIIDLYPQRQRGAQFAKLTACAGSAFVFGPFIGGGLAQFGMRVPLFTASAASFVALMAAYFYVLEPSKLLGKDKPTKEDKAASKDGENKPLKKERAATEDEAAADARNIAVEAEGGKSGGDVENQDEKKSTEVAPYKPYQHLDIYLISAQTMCTTIAFNGVSSLMALLLLEERLGVVSESDTVETQGQRVALWVMAYVPALGLTQVVVLTVAYNRVVKRIGLLPTGAVGSLLIAGALFVLPHWPAPGWIFITQFLLAIGNGLSTNVSTTYLAKRAPKGQAARTLAWGTFADTIGNIVGPFLTQLYQVDNTWPFYTASFFGLLSVVVCLVLRAMNKPHHDDHKKDTPAVAVSTKADGGGGAKPGKKTEEVPPAAIVTQLHPAAFHGPGGNLSTEMAELSRHLYKLLDERNHLYGFHSTREHVRRHCMIAHKDMLTAGVRAIPDPDDATNDRDFRLGWAAFLAEAGHEEWALNIPGVTTDDIVTMLQVPV